MRVLRNKNAPPNADLVQVYLQSSWDIVKAVYAALADIETVSDAIGDGTLDEYLADSDINTLAKLDAIVADWDIAAAQSKLDFISITQAVDLDALEAAVAGLSSVVTLEGTWDASSGVFPGGGTASSGNSWIVSTGGTVDGVEFAANDRIVATTDNASTATYAANWHKLDYTDQVLSVAGLTGAITAAALRTALNIEDGATADQTGAEIKALYEAEANAFTDALFTKLSGIETGATADQSAAEIKAAFDSLVTTVTQSAAEAGTSTTVYQWTPQRVAQAIAALAGSGALNKYDATTAPTTTDDAGSGYSPGSLWIDITNDKAYICLDATSSAAVWTEITQAGGGGGGGMTVTAVKTANYTASANEVVPVDSSGGAFTITLPSSPSAQDRVIIIDVGRSCSTYPVTVARNGNTLLNLSEDHVLDQDNARIDVMYDGSANWDGHLVGSPSLVSANGFVTGYSQTNERTGTAYSFVSGDLGACVIANNASPSTYDIPDNLAGDGETLNLLNIGAGTVTITVAGSDTLASTANTCPQGDKIEILCKGGDTWYVMGGT